jgi:hypothetical protein
MARLGVQRMRASRSPAIRAAPRAARGGGACCASGCARSAGRSAPAWLRPRRRRWNGRGVQANSSFTPTLGELGIGCLSARAGEEKRRVSGAKGLGQWRSPEAGHAVEWGLRNGKERYSGEFCKKQLDRMFTHPDEVSPYFYGRTYRSSVDLVICFVEYYTRLGKNRNCSSVISWTTFDIGQDIDLKISLESGSRRVVALKTVFSLVCSVSEVR